MNTILSTLFQHQNLNFQQAEELMLAIAEGQISDPQLAAILAAYNMRGITVPELHGFKTAMLAKAHTINLQGLSTIDVCGTGGDGKNTFNISTTAAFIVAGAGQAVAKHGNYAISSYSGSSTVIEQLGIRFTADQHFLLTSLEKANICFLHAPLFHPAMKVAGPVRRALGVPTFFNMLGPLLNPVNPTFQLVGVYNLQLARLYHYLLQQEGKTFTVLHDLAGYDEYTGTSTTMLYTHTGEQKIDPPIWLTQSIQPHDLTGGTTKQEAADILFSILSNTASPGKTAIATANAALALVTAGRASTFQEGYALATQSLKSGAALRALTTLQALSHELTPHHHTA